MTEGSATMKIHKVGIIGYGGFGRFLEHSWKSLENVRIAAVSDTRPPGDLPSQIKLYQNWKDLVHDEEIDIISIVTPPSSHAEIACDAMKEHKHVLIEKPLATTMEDARRILDTYRQTGVKATVNFMMRFNPIIEALGALTKKGVFGELRRADIENYAQDSSLDVEHWFWKREISGGILIEHGVHFIDIISSLTDQKPCQITGGSSFRNERQEDQVMASVIYDKGLITTHYHQFAYPGFFETTSIRLAYDLAVIDLEGWIPLKGRIRALVNSSTKKDLLALPGLSIIESRKVREADDISRPQGWGSTDENNAGNDEILSHGIKYDVDEMVSATTEIASSKAEVYSNCVSRVLEDLVNAIENPAHSLRVSVEDGVSALDIACKASSFASSLRCQ